MRRAYLFGFALAAVLLSAAPLAGQGCQMQFSVSVYTDGSVSDDLSTVYGYSNFVDNSTLCSCTHGNYGSQVSIYPPSGSSASNQQSGTESSTYISTFGTLGTYTVVGLGSLTCSCFGPVQTGGSPTPVPVQAVLTLLLSQTSCSIARSGGQAGTCQFVFGASAGPGFSGTVTGYVGVAQPFNPDNILLVPGQGDQAKSQQFTLAAGGTTSGTCNPPSNPYCFTVTTASGNVNSGTLTYTVTLSPGADATIATGTPGSKPVTVTVQ
ncbi:MAG TPA: hypothetical protein VMH28_26495 [Candidatus Acidoferrales bacterium]|nr:hypothetical protein [Candidatus Acidoferrales bacterium]